MVRPWKQAASLSVLSLIVTLAARAAWILLRVLFSAAGNFKLVSFGAVSVSLIVDKRFFCIKDSSNALSARLISNRL
jgi:hypothetical protein